MNETRAYPVLTTYRYLNERSGSSYRELFVCGTDLRAQSLVSDLENEGLSFEEVAAAYHIPLEAVKEAVEYVHANEEHLMNQRSLARQEAIAEGNLTANAGIMTRCTFFMRLLTACLS